MSLSEQQLQQQAEKFVERYSIDVTEELVEEVKHIKAIHVANFGEESLPPLNLLNMILKCKLQPLFVNCCVALRIFCTIPVTVAEAERSFSKLSLIKNYLRSTMSQDRLSDLGTLAIENQVARTVEFDKVIDYFAHQKARKAHLLYK